MSFPACFRFCFQSVSNFNSVGRCCGNEADFGRGLLLFQIAQLEIKATRKAFLETAGRLDRAQARQTERFANSNPFSRSTMQR
jgi:hypothetical protein